MGPSVVVAKQGEYGAVLITQDMFFALPAYPAGNGGRPDRCRRHVRRRIRRLHRAPLGECQLAHDLLSKAMAYGTALASFNVEEFGTEALCGLAPEAVRKRVQELWHSTRFDLDLFEFAGGLGRAAGPRSAAGVDGR